MKLTGKLRGVVMWSGATMTVALTTALLTWLGARSTTAGMIFLVLVVWTATQAGLALSLFIAVLCAFCFDYFFLPPLHTLILAGAQEWVAMLSFVASSVVSGRVAERARRQARHAEQRREDVERLYTLSQEMMLHEDAARLISELPQVIQRVFGLDAVALYVQDQDKFSASTPEMPMGMQASLTALMHTQGMMQVLPGEITAMPLMLGMRQAGALGWRPAILSREVATAMTAQVAIALTRALAIEASARLEAAREGERLRTALIDSLTHELRTPLTSIRAAATTLLQGDGLDDASRMDLAAIVDEESARLDALIGEAVEMAEIDANVLTVQAASQHTRAFLDQVVERSQRVLSPHHVVIAVGEPDDSVWFDPQLLGRVFRHLLENAARYCPPGSRIVLRSRRNGDRLEFSVEDNGPGIDAVDLPLIFEKFYRGQKGAAKGSGTGMGLAIARAILAAHGGAIEVSSQPGQGTTFRFWIPLIEKKAAPSL
jgi:two-component system, OmpR family, sensor histidine kinase KdpD